MTHSSMKRQQSYVSRIIQGSLLKQLGTYWLVSLCLIWHGLFLLQLVGFTGSAAQEQASLTYWERYLQFAQAHLDFVICAAATFPLFFWNALQLTHRIAGPLERFRDTLECLQRGESVKPLTLRRDDLLVEYQRAFNRYLHSLEQEQRSRGGLSKSTRIEPDAEGQPSSHPLLRELQSVQAEIQHAASDTQSPEA
jgi:hypothetical protein